MGRLAAVAAWFNAGGSELRASAFRRFADEWPREIDLYRLPEMDRPPIWQKERLLNLAIRQLPTDVDKVIWVDGDILIGIEGLVPATWAADASAALDRWPVIQPWYYGYFYGADGKANTTAGPFGRECVYSVPAARNELGPETLDGNSGLPPMAWPGFCWAARREVLEEIGGLYEHDLSGPNDVLMSLAFYGDFANSFLLRYGGVFRDHYMRWAERAYRVVQGNVGFVPATLTHLWHGPFDSRKYLERTVRLMGAGYDPAKHVTTAPDGSLMLTDDCPWGVRRLAAAVVGVELPAMSPAEQAIAQASIAQQTQAALSDGCCGGRVNITVG